jgi:hypothetical protein
MTQTIRVALITLIAAFVLTGTTASAQSAQLETVAPAAVTCWPGIATAYTPHAAVYNTLFGTLAPGLNTLRALTDAVVDQTTYATLLTAAHTVANAIPNGRFLIALPDGTVVVDTGKPDDAANVLPQGNSYQHFKDKTVNENHNSRPAIMLAELFECGFGVETKLSTSTGNVESYAALRMGPYLDSSGVARLSQKN